MFIAESNLIDVLDEINTINDWTSLGLQLGLEGYQLDEIDDNNRANVKNCRWKMISKWLDTGDASWRALVRALASKQVGKKGLAKRIADEHPLR